MNRKALSLAGFIIAAATAASTTHATQDGRGTDFTIPIVDLNNPCTRGHDSIDGELHVTATLKESDDARLLTVHAKGDALDSEGKDYRAVAKLRVKIHDPFPAHLFLQAKLIRDDHGRHHDNGHDNGNGNGQNGTAQNGMSPNGAVQSNGDWRFRWAGFDGRHDGHGGHDGKHRRRDDAVLNAIVHVNDRGNVTKVDISGIECKVIDGDKHKDKDWHHRS